MIPILPLTEYAPSDAEAHEALLADLHANPHDYLGHQDSEVRCFADWAMEFYKIRNFRLRLKEDTLTGLLYISKLYDRLRFIATPPREGAL